MVVHIFGEKDSPCCANYALKKTGRDNFDEYDASTIESVLKSFYMDDFLISEVQAITLCQETTQDLEIDAGRVEETLGISWKIKDEKFIFTNNMKAYSLTKQEILSTVSSIFDPLGFLTPFTFKAKLVIQLMWRKNLQWDDEGME